MKTALYFVVVLLAVAVALGIPGGKSPLTTEELGQEPLLGFVGNGLAKYHELKAASNGPACVEYTSEVISGTKQVVAGMSYELKVKFNPAKKTTDECTATNVDLNTLTVETCDVKIWDKVGDQPDEIKVENCNSSS